jgi:LacI family transcriptional regulator
MLSGKIRIKDIARLSGVSIGTVDRVLHERGEVALKTRDRVKQILKETNYSPNVMARVLKSPRDYHLASLLPEPSRDNSFWEKHAAGIEMAIAELELFNVRLTQVTFDMFNEKDFQRKADSLLGLKPDGVLLAPIFKSESVSFCHALTEIKIPFVFVDGFIENTDFLAYIGEDIFRSGRVAGQLADMITPDNKDILIISIARNIENVHHLINRMNGFLNYFENSGINKGRKIKVAIPDPSSATVKRTLDKAFRENPDIGSIFMSGSKSYLIASYLHDSGYKDINLIGYDLLDKNVRYLRSGGIRFLIGQRPEEQTYKAVRKLFDYLSLNKLPENMEYLPVDIITSENIDFFIFQDTKNTKIP